jgi:hypothetical protein
MCRYAAKIQHQSVLEKGWRNKGGLVSPNEAFDLDLRYIGQRGVLAVRKALGLGASSLPVDDEAGGPDIAPDIQVRNSRPGVIPYIRPGERFDHRWVFVWGKKDNPLEIIGWIEGEKVRELNKLHDFGRKDRPPVYIYDLELKPIKDLVP